jgi:nitrogen fixation/metabolism regulation signal transduction histidine kinase
VDEVFRRAECARAAARGKLPFRDTMSESDTRGTDEQTPEMRTRKRSAPWLFGGLVLVLLSALVALQVFGLWEIFTPETTSDTLLIYALSSLNFVAFLVFAFILIRSLVKLRRERRERLLGSKIKTRLVVYFIAVSLLPITAMALFSYMFFNRTLEKYFSLFPQDVTRQAQQAQAEQAARQAEALRELAAAVSVAAADAGQDGERLGRLLRASREQTHLAFLALVPPNGSQQLTLDAAAEGLGDGVRSELIRQAELSESERGEVRVEGKVYDVRVVPLEGGSSLVAAREQRTDASLRQLVAGAETFEEFKRSQRKVRMLGLSTIGLMTLLLLFAATWSAIHLARGLGAPIRALAEASKRVAGGDLSHRVTAIADDELAVLAANFNDMTAQLDENRRRLEQNASELREHSAALEERRGYIETVLESLSTGVVSLDEQNRVTTINAAAVQMLRLDAASPPVAAPLAELVSVEDYEVLSRVLWRARLRGRASEQTQLSLGRGEEGNGQGTDGHGQAVPVALTATALGPRTEDKRRGVVLVMEDLTELLAAQRAAAWSEVARRMAHEIKNPLTPIQLSAERIARNFRRLAGGPEPNGNGGAAAGDDAPERERVARVIEECTATIGREVAALKAMVDEFARFARLPHARLTSGDLNEVVRQAVALYEDRLGDARLDVLLAPRLPAAMLDAEQMRRVFVNLIDNALEALEDAGSEQRVTVATAHDPARGLLLAEIADTGHGIARADFPRLFQPYFSTRGRGTGLGLAIVQRVLADHGGRIRAESNRPHGARMIIELPVAEEERQGPGFGGRGPG